MTQRSAYGGQAVIEGVMIRGRDRVATAVRLNDGSITVRREFAGAARRAKWLSWPLVRGTPALVDSLRLGYRTLLWSADLTMEGESQPKPTSLQYFLSIAGALVFGIGVFVLLPTLVTGWLPGAKEHAAAGGLSQFLLTLPALLKNIVEGLIRLLFLVIYITLIGRMPDVRRLFAYHGAEHKVVNAWEAEADLTVDGARPFSRIHPRCGTSFLFLTFVVGILLHALIGWPSPVLRLVSRLLMLPLVAGVSYELIRLAGAKRNSLLLKVLVWPGMALQQLTTAEPADDQIEVAIASMRAVLEDEGVIAPVAPPMADASGSESSALA